MLLGQQIEQSYPHVSYGEDLTVAGDGPLVLFQLNDPGQTLFVSRANNSIVLASFTGRCRQLGSADIAVTIHTVPALKVEYEHAASLLGIASYPGGVVCNDDAGIVSVATYPSRRAPDESVALVYQREAIDSPTAYIAVYHATQVDVFSVEGGLRHDATDSLNTFYVTLDGDGQPIATRGSSATAATCEDVGREYFSCLVIDPVWLAAANAMAEEMTSLRNVYGTFGTCGSVLITWGVGTGVSCVIKSGMTFSSLLISGTGNLLQTSCRSQLPPDAVLCPPPPGSDPQCSAGGTCVLDEGNKFAYCVYPATTPGTCVSSRECGGQGYCSNSLCWTDPAPPETCDNYDNDCDLVIDSFPTTCGVGACRATGTCSAGADSCTPGTPTPDDSTCNGVDDDCDNEIDEDHVPLPTTCGVGLCARTGQLICTDGVLQDTCLPGSPSAEVFCNGIDDNCDGVADDGYYLALDGTGYVEVKNPGALSIERDFTVEFWAYRGDSSSPFRGVMKAGSNGAAWSFNCDVRDYFQTKTHFEWSANGSQRYGEVYTSLMPPGEWHHYAFTRSGSIMQTLIDGAAGAYSSTSAYTVYYSNQSVWIGAGAVPGRAYYALGGMDEVAIWNVARSASEIRTDMLGGITPHPNLVGYWNFNETSGPALDYSGRGHLGTFVGGAARARCASP